MFTQQDIYAAGSESHPPMLNKKNYVPWSSRLLRYAKSRPNGKLIHNSIINGPYIRRKILEPGNTNQEVPVNETFHVQTDDELTEKELKQIEADDQAIQTILLGLPEDIYATVDSCETAQEIWLQVQQMMKGSDIGIQERRPSCLTDGKGLLPMNGNRLSLTITPEWSQHVTIIHQTKDLHTADYTQLYAFLKYNQKENYMQQPMPNPEDITDPTTAINMELALMAKAFKLNYSTPTNNNQRISSNLRNRQIAQPGMNMGQDRHMQMVGGNGENQFRQYAGQNVGNLNGYNAVQNVENQLLISQKEEAGIQLQTEEFDLMAAAADLDEIEEVNANCILMANLQQASTSGALEPIPEPQQVPQNDNNVISEVTSVKQSGETFEQHPANFEETCALYDSLYQNLAIEVE
nr:integrase, catalytic region, zinc finger, CCHC-type, peptidase aspartic, catalytic [Tanacetum cinerariifolium]